MKKPTEQQIVQEIKKLQSVRDKVPPCTAFGDDNRASIDAQIDVLQENLIEDEVWKRWGTAEDGEDLGQEFHEAQRAFWWMRGENGETERPSKAWEELVRLRKGKR